jgi:NAD(P)-dependent dehydrogenase (short-subunit alcohol dehydrogenase family)
LPAQPVRKTIVMTGATSGLGLAAAETLATPSRDWSARLVIIARDRARGETTLEKLRKRSPAIRHAIYYADLSRLADVKRVAAEIAAAEPRIDVLINNAGNAFTKRRVTEDGLEMTFATNHMGPFVLTLGLLDRVRAAAPARIINTASMTYASAHLDFDNLQLERGFSGAHAYANSKLCNVLFTRELARRLAGTGVTVNCLHPGFVATGLGHEDGGIEAVWGISTAGALTPEQGSRTLVYLAASPEVENITGEYFSNRRPERLTREAMDETLARKLWEVSEQIASNIDLHKSG